MSSVGKPLTHAELLTLVRLLQISFHNTAKRRSMKSRDAAYRRKGKLLQMITYAPDMVRVEMKAAIASLKESSDDKK